MINSTAQDPQPCVLLPWDTNFFGFRIGRVKDSQLTEISTAAILEWSEKQNIRCLYFSGDGTHAETLQLAFRAGFQFIDVRVELALSLESTSAYSEPEDVIRSASPTDLGNLQALARKSHYDTRFFKDLGFPRHRAQDLYGEWIQRDLKIHHVIMATCPGERDRPAGYITCQIDPEIRQGRIGLIAVDTQSQGKGIGRALVHAGLNWFRASHCSIVNVATQASNLPALRLYQAVGFRHIESSVWFHHWFPSTHELQ
ncbi:hypothetical protein CMV30_12575 [Nibricoccus aquaticus]|uniref:N-acetyltransferase domain-containing protein n=1 Tax=Nibricoccus aquaticus TaxID=2576891 RepID=A0A290Q910_9BACT|nr:GNAT family N-acetyltransferase [Nibricoccus aquaticus]ATC64727.1 hypothetical protein CMV30_12575 [Nibricoccus aquaticus]